MPNEIVNNPLINSLAGQCANKAMSEQMPAPEYPPRRPSQCPPKIILGFTGRDFTAVMFAKQRLAFSPTAHPTGKLFLKPGRKRYASGRALAFVSLFFANRQHACGKIHVRRQGAHDFRST